MVPYGSKWIHVDPYGSIWIHMDLHSKFKYIYMLLECHRKYSTQVQYEIYMALYWSIWIHRDPKWIHRVYMNYVWIFQPSPVFGDVSWMVGDIKEEASMGKQARLFMREHLFLSIPLISTNSSNLAITEFPAIQAISTLTNSATSLKKSKKTKVVYERENFYLNSISFNKLGLLSKLN